MAKNTKPSRSKGPMALVLAAAVAVGAAVLGINPDVLRSGDADAIVNASQEAARRIVQEAGEADGAPAVAAKGMPSKSTPSKSTPSQRWPAQAGPERSDNAQWASFLPTEARQTVTLIQRGGPFPYRQDGTTFGNREKRLPQRERGWYREYTVDTPGLRHRGPRRIVTGGHPPSEWYYTADHYESFQSFVPPPRTH